MIECPGADGPLAGRILEVGMHRTIPIALAFLVAGLPAGAQAPTPPTPVIVTQGEAVVKRAPDRAWITVATETRDPRAAEARRRNAEAMTAVQATLKGAGVPANAIRTTGFAISPEFDYNDGRSILRGYVVRNQVEVRVDNLDRLSEILDAVNVSRNVAISVSGPRFDLKDERDARHEALVAAVEDAMARARALAAGAKRALGPVIRIDEQSVGSPPPPPMAFRMGAVASEAAPTPVTPGDIEIQARVSLTVELAK
jgi:uncharacterized protein YggE